VIKTIFCTSRGNIFSLIMSNL